MSKRIETSELKKYLRYDVDTGLLYWLPRSVDMFPCKCAHHRWNKRFAGKVAFTAKMQNGYIKGRMLGSQFLAHRVVWALVHGEWPKHEIDHIDGNPENNRIENLRDVPAHINRRNTSRRLKSKNPHQGINWVPRLKKWRVVINFDGVTHYLGVFDDMNEAIAVRKAAERENGFHENHGRANRRAA